MVAARPEGDSMSNKPSEENEQLPPLSGRDRDLLLDALCRPERPVPDPIRKAKKLYQEHVISDVYEGSGNGSGVDIVQDDDSR
jgi:hypothetical protein